MVTDFGESHRVQLETDMAAQATWWHLAGAALDVRVLEPLIMGKGTVYSGSF